MASEYFRSGADKVSIGSDAVLIVEEYSERRLDRGAEFHRGNFPGLRQPGGGHFHRSPAGLRRLTGGNQAPGDPNRKSPVPKGKRYCWYQCTIKGGREGRDLDAVTLAQVCEDLGAGEILLNCIDRDGTNLGFDLELINAVEGGGDHPGHRLQRRRQAPGISTMFLPRRRRKSALAAGIFHRGEVPIGEVKRFLEGKVEIRK